MGLAFSSWGRILAQTTNLLAKFFAQIPPEELSERIHSTFKRFDTNADGNLQRSERADDIED